MSDTSTQRLDQALVALGLAKSRERAKALIEVGAVEVDGEVVHRASAKVGPSNQIRLLQEDFSYVSRGALKLAGAVADFSLTVADKWILDVGASTGGFTDFVLQHGAKGVFAVDVGSGQLDPRLQNDPRVTSFEKQDIRQLSRAQISQKIDMILVDVAFISLAKVLPALQPFMESPSELVALVKPQFEVGPSGIEKGGIVRDGGLRDKVCADMAKYAEDQGWRVQALSPSKIVGADGNQEYFLYAKI